MNLHALQEGLRDPRPLLHEGIVSFCHSSPSERTEAAARWKQETFYAGRDPRAPPRPRPFGPTTQCRRREGGPGAAGMGSWVPARSKGACILPRDTNVEPARARVNESSSEIECAKGLRSRALRSTRRRRREPKDAQARTSP